MEAKRIVEIEPSLDFEQIGKFSEGLAAVRKGGKWVILQVETEWQGMPTQKSQSI